jgi:hypothetical protein
MLRLLLIALTFVVVVVSLLCGVLAVVNLATGRLLMTAVLSVGAAATAWLAFHLPVPWDR